MCTSAKHRGCVTVGACKQADEEGIGAIVHLGRGDMRQTLNILQSVVMAHGSISLEFAYLCTGNPTPDTIEAVVRCLMSENMAAAYKRLHEMQVRRTRAHLPS
jgi:replication factor C subunit 3/5